MTQTITRQCQWPEGNNVVEVNCGGIDYANADALCAKYPGEFQEFKDPIECIETAITIARQWQLDNPEELIEIATGNTHGFTIPFEGEAVRLTPELLEEKIVEYINHAPWKPTDGRSRHWAKRKVAKDYPDGWNEPLFAALRADAKAKYDALPKCDQCGEPLLDEKWRLIDRHDDAVFCREYCAEKYQHEEHKMMVAEGLIDEDDT
jgi:hypothetical protein